ncbi:MAG: hypothetical protein AAFO69_14740 [Bacteroidota bacterium]
MRRVTYVIVTLIGLSFFASCSNQSSDFEEIIEQVSTTGHAEDEDCNENC